MNWALYGVIRVCAELLYTIGMPIEFAVQSMVRFFQAFLVSLLATETTAFWMKDDNSTWCLLKTKNNIKHIWLVIVIMHYPILVAPVVA